MATTKVVGTICALSAITGTASLITILLLEGGMPEYETLNSPGSGMYVSDYKNYFVDATKKSNNDWWEWAFRNRYELDTKPVPGSKFLNVDGGVGKDRSLNGKCEDVYKQPKANINTQSTHDPDKYSEDEVWRYCSLLSKKPKTIEEAKTTDTYKTENTYGKQNKDKLIDPNHEDNEDFWNLKNAEFLGLKGAKAKREQVTNSNSIFYNANKSVKQLCNIAYFETTNGNSTPLEDVFKFCSLKGEQ